MKNFILKSIFILTVLFASGCSSDSDPNNVIINPQCPPGFTGPNCDIPAVPTSIKITKIWVYKFPNTDAGSGWDGPGTLPDIFLKIYKGSNKIYTTPTFYPNAESNSAFYYEFILEEPLISYQSSDIFDIQLWDYDQLDAIPTDDDYMGGIYFGPFTENNATSVIVNDLSNNVKYEVFLSYQW